MISFEKKYFFIAGLPRSGSTLLSSILSQNPNIYSAISSPVLPIFRSVYDIIAEDNEFSSLATPSSKECLLKGVFDNYYSFTNKNIVFDTNRVWPNTFYAIKKLFPYTKIILLVRDIPWIMDSFEKARNSNPLLLSNIFPKEHDYNVYSRADSLMRENGIVYSAYFAAKSIWYSEFASDIILVEYDKFVKNPELVMNEIYHKTNIEYFKHDFNRTEKSYEVYDNSLGIPGLHTTRNKVEYIERKSILPPEIWNKFSGMEFWK